MNPKPGLAGVPEARVIAFAFGTKGVGTLEGSAGSVNGKSVIVGDGDIPGTAAVLLAVVPILVIAGAHAGFGIAERAAELLPGTNVIGGLAILMHGEAGLAEKMAGRQHDRVFGVSPVERDDGFAPVDVTDGIVDRLGIIAFVGNKGAFLDGDNLAGSLKNIEGDSGISDICGRGDLVDGQAGDTIHEDVVLVSPEELVVLLVVLV